MEKTKFFVVNARTGKERPVAAGKVLEPLPHFDGWQNVVTGLGGAADKRMAATVKWNPYTMEEYEQMYSGDELCARIVDIIPNDALREWLEPQGYEKNVLKAVKEKMSALDMRGSCERSWKWARAFGGCLQHIVTDTDDPSSPLNAKKEKVLSLREFSRYDIRILTTDIESDLGSENYGRPNIYYLNVQMGATVKLYPVHWTRMVRYDGKLVPRRTYIRNNYWHDSELQRLFNVIRNYQTSNDAAAGIMQDFNTGVFKMKDLANLMSSGKEALVKKRIEMVNYGKSTIRAMMLDADSEEWGDLSRNVTGLPEMLDHQARRFVAATDIPHTKMLGESPDGSNATGNSTQQMWFSHIRAEQNIYLRPKLNVLFKIIFWDMEELTYEFNSLHHLTDNEEAEMRAKNAEADSKYISDGVLDPTEVAKSRFGGDTYGNEIKLDMEARKKGLIGQISQGMEMGEVDEFGNPVEGGEGEDATPPPVNQKKDDDDPADVDFESEDEDGPNEGKFTGEAPGMDLGEDEEEYNPWDEEEEGEMPASLQDKKSNPEGLETPRDQDHWSLHNNETPARTDKQVPFISQSESLPFRDPRTDPKLPPPGSKSKRKIDFTGKFSVAQGRKDDKDFKENDHPRAQDGKFGSGGGGAAANGKKSEAGEASREKGSAPSPDEGKAIRLYTGSMSAQYKKADRDPASVDEDMRARNEALNGFLERAPKFEGDIHRGIVLPEADAQKVLEKYKPGTEVAPDSKESWTKDPKSVSDRLIQVGRDMESPKKIFFEYPASAAAVDISEHSRFPEEQEVLVPKGTKYKVKEVKQEADGYRVIFEGVGGEDSSVKPRRDAAESALMPRQLDYIKTRRKDGTSIVVRCGNSILLGKRRDSGKWCAPGGCCEAGETAKLAARRELWEETGIRPAGARLSPMKTHATEEGTVSTFQCILIPNGDKMPAVDHTLDPDKEFTELRWVDVEKGLLPEIAQNLHFEPCLALIDAGILK